MFEIVDLVLLYAFAFFLAAFLSHDLGKKKKKGARTTIDHCGLAFPFYVHCSQSDLNY